MTERPAPDPQKMLDDWLVWEKGEMAPGRLISNLTTAGLRQILETLAEAQSQAATDK